MIDDSYNANPKSMIAGLDVLSSLPDGRKIAVLGDMLELGERGPLLHEETVRYALDLGCMVRLYGPIMGDASDLVGRKGEDFEQMFHFTKMEKLIENLRSLVRSGDHVLVKGSRGMRMERSLIALDQFKQEA